MSKLKLAILGTVGVPGNYGGFETLAENLVRFHDDKVLSHELIVYCSAPAWETRVASYRSARLRYIALKANGPQSVLYDIFSLFDAIRIRADVILLLGISGALVLPIIRGVSSARIVTNIDGIEWKRAKWRGLAKTVLRWSEAAAVRWSHVVIADNKAIAEHVQQTYGRGCCVIAYGGDHALSADPALESELILPQQYVFGLCRIEPENNVALILEAFSRMPEHELVFVGNWENSAYGRDLRARFGGEANLHLLDPVYDPGQLRRLRNGASAYVHGHSAGGTNPALVEMMHFGIPIFAHGCVFNRYTTEEKAAYFLTADALVEEVKGMHDSRAREIGHRMRDIAQKCYTWEQVGRSYFELLQRT